MSWKRVMLERPLRRAGLELIAQWRLERYPLARHLERVLARRRVDCVLDVGAHDGGYGRFLRSEVGYTGRIISFEPQPGAFAALSAHAARDPAWHPMCMALGAESGEGRLNVTERTTFSSLLAPDRGAVPHSMAESVVVRDTMAIRVERLDRLMAELAAQFGFERPYLKMDTQGFDLQVFAGAAGCLDRIVGLQSEVSVLPIYVGMPAWQEAIAHYSQAGFALSGLYPVSHDEQDRVVEFDAVFVRSS